MAHTLCARRDGMLALKPERLTAVEEVGGAVLEIGQRTPVGAILIADCRPKGFIGGRTADDPAATAIYTVSAGGALKLLHRFEDFGRALRKAKKLAA